MKRFYCTVCKKVKRVRKYPVNIQDADATQPVERIGQCNRHAIEQDWKLYRKAAR